MKVIVNAFFAALCLCCTVNTQLLAQPEDIISRTYTMKDGLTHNYATCLLQDSQGFLWVGTPSGLNKFDGYHFTTYRENPSDSNSLTNNQVKSLWEDQQQRLWVGTRSGLDLFDLKTEKFHPLLPDSLDSSYGSDIDVHKIRERKDGKVWICASQGIYLADPQTLSMTRFIHFPQDADENGFWDIAEARDGSLWVGSGRGLVHIEAYSGKMTRYRNDPSNPHSLADDLVWTVYVDLHDRVWVGTDYGLDLFNPEEQSFTHFSLGELQFVGSGLQVRALLEHPDGTFWVGSSNGLFAFDPETGASALLVEKYMEAVYKDRQGIIWCSSNGLYQIAPQSKKFTIYRQFGQTEVASIGTLAEDANHHIWIHGYNPGLQLFRYDPSTRRFFQFLHDPENPQSFSGDMIWSITPDHEGGVWMATQVNLEKFNPKNQTFSSIPISIVPIGQTAIFQDSQGMLWVGGWDKAGKYDPQNETYEQLADFPHTTVTSFLEDREGNIWIGTYTGLFRYSLQTGQLDVFKNDPADPQSLSNNTVYHLMMDQKGALWVGTGGGLNKMIPGTENEEPKFIHWRSTHTDLPHDDVFYIVDGGDSTLWMSCGNSITHFNLQTGIFRNYDHNDGLSGQSHGNYVKGLRSYNGEIYFGSDDGLVVFHPDSLQDNPYIPQIAITGFSINNHPVPVRGSYGDTVSWETPLGYAIPYTNAVELTYQQNDFSLEFAALNFINSENNLYKYKLEPYEKDWIETSASNRIARYTNLSPGEYTFRVIGSNNDGLWNEEGRSLSIIIHPPWWQTWWAYALYGLLALGTLWTIRYYEIKRVKLRQRAAYLTELDSIKTRFFANISHEFRTPLTLILGPLKDMYEGTFNGDRKAVFGVMIRNGQRLLNLISQLLDISKLEAGKMQLQVMETDLVVLLRHIASAYESIAIDKKIKYFFYSEVQELIMYADPEKIEKIVHNLLSNAFKFTPERGEVILHLKTQDQQWAVLSVKDTGKGIPNDELDKVFDRFYQVDSSQTRAHEGSGLGMALAKELVEMHHGRLTVESKEGKGTTFTVWLPKSKAHLRPEEIRDTVDVETSEKYLYEQPDNIEVVAIEDDAAIVETNNNPLILVVEDNADMRHYIRSILEHQYQIREAENGKEGIIMAKGLLPDLIISDIMMPEMDGFRLCERIKTHELTSHIPVILLTAKADRQSKLTGLETGADDYIAKPFDAEELKLIVRNHIEERRKIRERFGKEITLEPKQISITSLDEKFLRKVLNIIEKHMADEDFTIEDLSKEAGYSQVQFYRKIKALSDQSPSQFLRTIRLKRAAALLQQKSDTISQIAYGVGFNNLSYFNKCFKEQFGMTPGQYAAVDQETE